MKGRTEVLGIRAEPELRERLVADADRRSKAAGLPIPLASAMKALLVERLDELDAAAKIAKLDAER